MKPGDSLEVLLAEAAMGTCGHVRQVHPWRPTDLDGSENLLECATPGCPWGTEARWLAIMPPRALSEPAPKLTRLEKAEGYADPLVLRHGIAYDGRRFWLWRFP